MHSGFQRGMPLTPICCEYASCCDEAEGTDKVVGYGNSKCHSAFTCFHDNPRNLEHHSEPYELCRSRLASDTTNGIRNALPVVPLASRNEWVQRLEHLLFAEFCDEFFKLPLNFQSHWCAKLRRDFCPAASIL
jgi:hypothetical protein